MRTRKGLNLKLGSVGSVGSVEGEKAVMEMPATQTSKIARRGRDVQLGEVAGVYPLEVFMRLTGLNRWAVREARRNGLVTIKIGKRRYVRAQDFAAYCQRLADCESAQGTLEGK